VRFWTRLRYGVMALQAQTHRRILAFAGTAVAALLLVAGAAAWRTRYPSLERRISGDWIATDGLHVTVADGAVFRRRDGLVMYRYQRSGKTSLRVVLATSDPPSEWIVGVDFPDENSMVWRRGAVNPLDEPRSGGILDLINGRPSAAAPLLTLTRTRN
jgi:hypothetical protein